MLCRWRSPHRPDGYNDGDAEHEKGKDTAADGCTELRLVRGVAVGCNLVGVGTRVVAARPVTIVVESGVPWCNAAATSPAGPLSPRSDALTFTVGLSNHRNNPTMSKRQATTRHTVPVRRDCKAGPYIVRRAKKRTILSAPAAESEVAEQPTCGRARLRSRPLGCGSIRGWHR